MDSSSQIKLDTGRFLGSCAAKAKLAAILTICFNIISVIGGVLKLGECVGETDLKILYTSGIVVNCIMLFFAVHMLWFGLRKSTTGFLELPLMGFEIIAFAYYILFGYIRLSRLASLSGFLPKLLGWSYAAYILLIAASCAVVLSFLKSGFIIKAMSSLLVFISDLGIISCIMLVISYSLCLGFDKYSPDEYILFSGADTVLLLAAPLLLCGYWALFRKAGSEIEITFNKIYRRLIKSSDILELEPDESEDVKETKENEKTEEAKAPADIAKENIEPEKERQEEKISERVFTDVFSVPFENADSSQDTAEQKQENENVEQAEQLNITEEQNDTTDTAESAENTEQTEHSEHTEHAEQAAQNVVTAAKANRFEEFIELDNGDTTFASEQGEHQKAEIEQETEAAGYSRIAHFSTPDEDERQQYEPAPAPTAEQLKAEKEAKRQLNKQKAKSVFNTILKVLTVIYTCIVILVLFVINIIPAIIKCALYAAAWVVSAFGNVRYYIAYGLRMVLYDGNITHTKRKKMSAMHSKTKKCANSIKQKAKNIKIIGVNKVKNSRKGEKQ